MIPPKSRCPKIEPIRNPEDHLRWTLFLLDLGECLEEDINRNIGSRGLGKYAHVGTSEPSTNLVVSSGKFGSEASGLWGSNHSVTDLMPHPHVRK